VAREEALTPRRRLWIGGVTFVLAILGFLAGRNLLRPAERASQPVAFNHALHVEDIGVECQECHLYFATSRHSGLPGLEVCMGCHEGGLTDSPEESKLLALHEAGETYPFRKLFRLPDHVNYSHRTHVVVAEIECEVCHGPIARSSEPPTAPLVRITMDGCLRCHLEQGARTDCTPCHR